MATAIYIVDASIALKWITQDEEENSEEAHAFLADITSGRVVGYSVDFLLIEYANVLLKGKKFSEKNVYEALYTLSKIPLKFFPIELKLLQSALKLASTFHQTVYDALYLALAKRENAKVITADNKLASVGSLTLPLASYKSPK